MSWPVALCLVLTLLLPGLIGRELWRGDDAEQFGVIAQLLDGGSWLTPTFQSEIWNQSPLYYWINALIAWPFSYVLDLPSAARIGNLFWVSLTVVALYETSRTWLSTEAAKVLPFLLLGAPGLMLTAHETQPDLAVMTGYAIFFWGTSRICFEKVTPGSTLSALGLGVTALSGGMIVTLPLVAVLVGMIVLKPDLRLNTLVALLLGLLLGSSWFVHAAAFADVDAANSNLADALFQAIWPTADLRSTKDIAPQLLSLLKLIAWSTWPAWPIALWTLWRRRLTFWQRENVIPLATILLVIGFEISCSAIRPSKSLVLLVPIVLLAAASVTHLRRGAANLLDAFTLTLFTLTALFVWLGWSALHFAWPEHLAQTATRLEPGFKTSLTLIPPAIAFLLTAVWFVLMRNIPRSPVRGIQHWFAGITLIWALVVTLWLPWIDHGMSFTRLGQQLGKALNEPGCVSTYRVDDDVRAALSFQLNRDMPRVQISAGKTCRWLLVQNPGNQPETTPSGAWGSANKVWSGHRRGNRAERYSLYYRNDTPTSVSEPATPATGATGDRP